MLEDFQPLVRSPFNEYIREFVEDKLKSALNQADNSLNVQDEAEMDDSSDSARPELTQAENEALSIIREIVAATVPAWRIELRPFKAHSSVMLLDDDRDTDDYGNLVFYLNVRTDYLRMNVRGESIIKLDSLDSLYEHRDWIQHQFSRFASVN